MLGEFTKGFKCIQRGFREDHRNPGENSVFYWFGLESEKTLTFSAQRGFLENSQKGSNGFRECSENIIIDVCIIYIIYIYVYINIFFLVISAMIPRGCREYWERVRAQSIRLSNKFETSTSFASPRSSRSLHSSPGGASCRSSASVEQIIIRPLICATDALQRQLVPPGCEFCERDLLGRSGRRA